MTIVTLDSLNFSGLAWTFKFLPCKNTETCIWSCLLFYLWHVAVGSWFPSISNWSLLQSCRNPPRCRYSDYVSSPKPYGESFGQVRQNYHGLLQLIQHFEGY